MPFSRRCTASVRSPSMKFGMPTCPFAEIIRPHMAETAQLLNDALREGKHILFEGAQGTLLDIDHGTYPFVTSSSCCARVALLLVRALAPRLSIACSAFRRPTSRALAPVRSPPNSCIRKRRRGPKDAIDGDLLCAEGHEYGVTTGRKRRCGWFDAVIARYAAEVNGLPTWL